MFAAAHPEGWPDTTAAVAAWMNRQASLHNDVTAFEVVLSEAGLRWRLGPRDLMLAQLDRLRVVMSLPNVRLGIIPLEAEVPIWHSHGFTIFDDREGGPVVDVETLATSLNVRNPDDVGRYLKAFARLQAAAVTGDQARVLLEQLTAGVR